MPLLGDAELGAHTFFARRHAANQCGSNGLPLTLNSVIIEGRFQYLTNISHRNLCSYLDLVASKGAGKQLKHAATSQERLVVVTEWHSQSLTSTLESGEFATCDGVKRLAFDVLSGLAHANQNGLVHRALSTDKIRLHNKVAKLHDFGMYYMTLYGASVPFCIGTPRYLAPELVAAGPDCCTPSSPKVDVWALGIILAEVLMSRHIWPDLDMHGRLRLILLRVLDLARHSDNPVRHLFQSCGCLHLYQALDPDVDELLKLCLTILPSKRPTAEELLQHRLFAAFSQRSQDGMEVLDPGTSCFDRMDRCKHLNLIGIEPSMSRRGGFDEDVEEEDPLSVRTQKEVLYWWRLAGGDLDQELRKCGLIRSQPPVTGLPSGVLVDGVTFGQAQGSVYRFDDTVVPLPLISLRERVKQLGPECFYPLLEKEGTSEGQPTEAQAQLPLAIRERDLDYQIQRLVYFQRLLEGYPYSRDRLSKAAQHDIPPPVRAHIWAALLGVKGDYRTAYEQIDKDSETNTDRQIEVDIPRCHQYNSLLASPEGHRKFKRVLKAWLSSNPNWVYWQGIDSLSAAFIWLNFNNEALAYASLKAFIPKYLNDFFLKDNSAVVQEYLAVFFQAIAFHDPVLFSHLEGMGFMPELYAIPWYLTMFTHVFPLHKIFHLWDTLLLYDSSLPILIGVSILMQLRETLLEYAFNECILLFSDMPDVDIQRCLTDARKLYSLTPTTCLARRHDLTYKERPPSSTEPEILSLAELRTEIAPCISPTEVAELCHQAARTRRRAQQKTAAAPIVLDIRTRDEYMQGHIPRSMHVPAATAFNADGQIMLPSVEKKLSSNKESTVIVVANRGVSGPDFARKLVHLGYARVCVVRGGASYLSALGLLTAFKENE
ncbi:TBC domain-containing protein kinase-like protein isoform X1 [Sycon ciliatum]|uniref:TBC domain-containing protein kinase-like protein isoform X1 n=1 Tax=Sycon ciliatum TaxID=27933 RepID=UPI0031F6FD00